jgi:beta-galactosidase beta subunit
MMQAENSLEQEFVKDHQKLTRGFTQIIKAVKDCKWSDAAAAAKELNREGGSHIAFEEDVLYPRVAQSRSEQSVRHLYEAHQDAIAAIQLLLTHSEGANFTPDTKLELVDKLQTGLDHAVSCGTLLGYLTVLDEKMRDELLAKLEQHRAEGKSMTDLAVP